MNRKDQNVQLPACKVLHEKLKILIFTFFSCILPCSVRIRENSDQKKTTYLDIFRTVKIKSNRFFYNCIRAGFLQMFSSSVNFF